METEEGYRRGTVLGLTIAEIFILLVFLMLLALMGVNRYWGSKLGSWKEIITQHTPEEVQAALKHPDRRRQEIASLTRQIEELKKEKERLQERIRTLEDREGKIGELLDETEEKLREVERDLAEGEKALAEATQEGSRLNHENADLQDEVASLGNQIRIFGKGITPPCWYQRVEETNPLTQANWREKPYYLFDIAIREDHMEVQRLPIPDGAAVDDSGAPYTEEAKELQLETIPYGVPLTDTELRNAMQPLYERGKASEVRSYSCIFYVRVWDETPPGAKERWKQAHDGVLEQLFGTHQVRGTSWRDRDEEPVNVPVKAIWQGVEDRTGE